MKNIPATSNDKQVDILSRRRSVGTFIANILLSNFFFIHYHFLRSSNEHIETRFDMICITIHESKYISVFIIFFFILHSFSLSCYQ